MKSSPQGNYVGYTVCQRFEFVRIVYMYNATCSIFRVTAAKQTGIRMLRSVKRQYIHQPKHFGRVLLWFVYRYSTDFGLMPLAIAVFHTSLCSTFVIHYCCCFCWSCTRLDIHLHCLKNSFLMVIMGLAWDRLPFSRFNTPPSCIYIHHWPFQCGTLILSWYFLHKAWFCMYLIFDNFKLFNV